MTSPESLLNHTELRRYLGRIGDRWPLERAVLGGARVADARGAMPQRELSTKELPSGSRNVANVPQGCFCGGESKVTPRSDICR